MANATKWAAIGLDSVLLSVRGSSGYFAGWAGLTTASTPNTGSGLYRFIGAQSLPVGMNEAVFKSILGDDGVVTTFQFDSTDPVAGTMEQGVEDIAVSSKAENTTNYALGEWTMSALGGKLGSQNAFMALVVRKAVAKDTSNDGTAGFINELWFNWKLTAQDDEGRSHQQEGKFRYGVAADSSTVTPWGTTCLATFGVTSRMMMRWFTPNRFAMECFVGNNANAAIPLTYTPISTAKTKAFKVSDGSALTVSSVSTGGKTATVSAAPASGEVDVVLYETSDSY